MKHSYYAIKDTSRDVLVENRQTILILTPFKQIALNSCESFNGREEKENGTRPFIVVEVTVKEGKQEEEGRG